MTYRSTNKNPKRRFYLKDIYGDCLERRGIRNIGGGYAIIDRDAEIRIGDIVHCSKCTGSLNTMLKEVKAINGDTVTVGTAYADKSKNFTFEAAEIYGVVMETYGKLSGFREYKRGESDGSYQQTAE